MTSDNTMRPRGARGTIAVLLLVFIIVGVTLIAALARPLPAEAAVNTAPPAAPVKLIFIHHSTGESWLADDHGGLGLALRDNDYFVSDTNYGWGPDEIGDHHRHRPLVDLVPRPLLGRPT